MHESLTLVADGLAGCRILILCLAVGGKVGLPGFKLLEIKCTAIS